MALKKQRFISTEPKSEQAVLVGVELKSQTHGKAKEYLDELAFLAETGGAHVVKKFLQKLDYPNPRTFIGEGKLAEVAAYVKEHQVDSVIFDDELSPSQIRNIEKALNCKIIDRSTLILHIFALNARTAQAKTQVELAQAQYLLPRLTRMWEHLTKHAGGIGTRGPGETELETDRRAIRNRISLLKERLNRIEKTGQTQRSTRDRMVRVALVGYTNAGKSSLMNLLTKSEVLVENKLFATLDTTVRKMFLTDDEGHTVHFLLSDTVGFIRKLPHHLVECFKSTLDEVREADILLHVVDISHPSFEDQIRVVQETLVDIGAGNKPTLLVFNKIDAYKPHEDEEGHLVTLEYLKRTYLAWENRPVLFVSVREKENVDELRGMLMDMVALARNRMKSTV